MKIRFNNALIFIVFGIAVAGVAYAATSAAISYPVSELGNCGSKQECKSYCDEPANYTACIAFAKDHGLIASQDAARMQKIQSLIAAGGPGGCTTEKSCKTFCSDPSNFAACAAYAEEHGLTTREDAARVKALGDFKTLKQNGATPGGCFSATNCSSYCSQTEHAKECLVFGEKNGLISSEDAAKAAKILPLIKNRKGPGSCSTPDACRAYCADSDHTQECESFIENAGARTLKQENALPGQSPQKEHTSIDMSDAMRACVSLAVGPEMTDKLQRGLVPDASLRLVLQHCAQTIKSDHEDNPAASTMVPTPVIPDDLLHGGATNLPEPHPVRTSLRVHSYLGSVMRFLFGL